MSVDLNTFTIPPLDPQDTDTARDQINSRLAIIQGDLNELAGRFADITTKSAVIKQDVPISDDVVPGMMVYFNGADDHMRYEPAQALLLGEPGTNGRSVEAPCARVEGMIISTDTRDSNNIVGTLLLGGWWKSQSLLMEALGEDYETPGTYYLSGDTPGLCTSDPGVHLRQPLLANHGGGEFSLSIFYMAHDNHFHGSAELGESWVSVSTRLPQDGEGQDIPNPGGAQFWYDAGLEFLGIGELDAATTAVFYHGILQLSSDSFVVSGGYLWYKGSTTPAAGTVTVFNHYPFAYGSPVMRGVESTNGALSVRTINGRVFLTANDFIGGSMARNAVAVSAIAGNVVQFTPVVSGIAAGPGIAVESAVNGVATISSAEYVNVPLDAYSVFHKGTNIVCDDDYLYIAFPANRDSSLVMSLPVRNVNDATTLRAYAYCCGVGTGGNFNVQFYWAPQPTAGATSSLNHTAIATTTLGFNGASADTLTYAETPIGADITGPGQLSARISIQSAPETEVRMLRVGFRLEVVSAAISTVQVTDVTSVDAVINTMTSGGTIALYNCVRSVSGAMAVCTSANAAAVNQCIGVAIDAGTSGNDLRYLIQGVIENNGFAFTAGQPIYISPSGTLTQTNPASDSSARFIQQVGVALTPSIVQINIQPGILKES